MRVLITGAGSYLGGAILGALRKQGVEADELDVRGPLPEKAFQGYDRVVHVAGIAHRKETPENRPLYEQVNHRLADCPGRQSAGRAAVRVFQHHERVRQGNGPHYGGHAA